MTSRLRPIPVLGIGIGPIPVVLVWYRYSLEAGNEATSTAASAPKGMTDRHLSP